jgi:hypothetical protein
MKPLRAHDVLPNRPEQDFRGLHRIMAALFAAMVFCLVVCTALIIRDTGTHEHATRQAVLPCACRCRSFPWNYKDSSTSTNFPGA